MLWNVDLYAVNVYCSDWLINKVLWPIVRQNKVTETFQLERKRRKAESGDTSPQSREQHVMAHR